MVSFFASPSLSTPMYRRLDCASYTITASSRCSSDSENSVLGSKYGWIEDDGKLARRSPKPSTAVRRTTPGLLKYHTSLSAKAAARLATAPTLPVLGTTLVMVNVAGEVPCRRYGRLPLSSTSSLIEGTRSTRSEPSLLPRTTLPALLVVV